MKLPTKKQLLKWSLILVSLFSLHVTTFYLVSGRQLESKLLPGHFQMRHHSDSAYVRDFYITDCNVGDQFTTLSHNLRNSQELKEKLGVKFVAFQEPGTPENGAEKNFNLTYHTWVQRWDWLPLTDLFTAQQTEELMVDKNWHYTRMVTYKWCLFFWIETFEYISSGPYCATTSTPRPI
jgi:hypothetical protein